MKKVKLRELLAKRGKLKLDENAGTIKIKAVKKTKKKKGDE